MKIFELGFNDWDSSYRYQLIHTSKTEVEFDADVKHILTCMKIKEIGLNANCWIGTNDILEYINKKLLLIGYEEPQIHNKYFGGSTIIDREDEIELSEYLSKDKIDVIIEHNESIAANLENEYE